MAKKILMLSTSSLGGMLSVVEGYKRDGLFDIYAVDFIATHDKGSPARKLGMFLGAFIRVFVQILLGRVALLHCHVSMGKSFWRKSSFSMLARLFKIPVMLHLHGSETKKFYDSLSLLGKRLFAKQLNQASKVLVLSNSWRLFVLDVAPDARVFVLPNYVEIPELNLKSKPEKYINILFLGLIGERKGIYDLLKVFSSSMKQLPHVFLRIGGDGEIEKAKALIQTLGLTPRVECLGWVCGDAKNELLRTADIFVLPSYNEGLPVSILEAMSWGIPVIATDVGGIPELIETGVNGFLIRPGDLLALQIQLESLSLNPELRSLIGAAARESIQKYYAKEIILPRLTSLYDAYVNRA